MADVLADAVASAMSAVAFALPSLSLDMTADGCSGKCVLTSSVSKDVDPASPSGAAETRRFVAKASDFPDLSRSALVSIGGENFIITSLKLTGGAAWFFGTSGSMSHTVACVTGSRRSQNRVRTVSATAPALVARDGSASPFDAEAFAMTGVERYWLVIRENDWNESERPSVGDSVRFNYEAREITAAVSSVEEHGGYFTLTLRSR